MTTTALRPGADTALKLRLARLSGEATRALGGAVTRECSDLRVRRALDAALADPALSDRARRELLTIAESLGADADDDPRAVTLRFRATEDEAAQIRERADAAGLTLSDYLRRVALAE